jgi:hypothetical protein
LLGNNNNNNCYNNKNNNIYNPDEINTAITPAITKKIITIFTTLMK